MRRLLLALVLALAPIGSALADCDPSQPQKCYRNGVDAPFVPPVNITPTPNPDTIFTAQVRIDTTGVAKPVPSVTGVNGFVIRAKPSNIGIGGYACAGPAGVTAASDGTGTGDCQPAAGGAWAYGVSASGAIYLVSAAGDVFMVSGN